MERVERVASEIGLTFYLAKTNRSLSYIFEESGANLRTGEKQLISFARILIFDPEIEDGSPQKLVSEDSVFKQMLADQSYQE